MTEKIRETCEGGADGRITIPAKIQHAVNIKGQKFYCQAENYGKDKILLTIMSRWAPDKRIKGKVKKQ